MAQQPDYQVIGHSFDQLRDEVLKIQNQSGTAEQITNVANHLNTRLDGIATQLGNLVASVQQLSNEFHMRIGAVEGQLQVLNESNNL